MITTLLIFYLLGLAIVGLLISESADLLIEIGQKQITISPITMWLLWPLTIVIFIVYICCILIYAILHSIKVFIQKHIFNNKTVTYNIFDY